MKKILLTLACSFPLLVQALTITSFGTGSWTVDPLFNTVAIDNQDASSLTFTGPDNGVLSGTITSVDASSVWGIGDLTLTGSVATNPGTQFSVLLYDGSFNIATFTGGSFTALASVGSSILTLTDQDAGFDNTNVIAIDLSGGGAGDTISATLTGASIVPEPSAFALIAGCFGLALVMMRRRA